MNGSHIDTHKKQRYEDLLSNQDVDEEELNLEIDPKV
jgi:hypothetical protein